MFNENFAQQGWQCPICNRVYLPATPMCYYCGDNSVTVTSTGTGSIPMPIDPSTTGVKPKPNYSITISDNTTSDVQTPTDDSPKVEKCDSSCKFWGKPWSYDKCRSCNRNLIMHYKGITDNWEAKG